MKNHMLKYIALFLVSWAGLLHSQDYGISWTKSLLEPMDNDMEIIETSDGYYMFTGTVYNDAADIGIVKIDALGNPQWTKYYGGPADQSANAIIETNNNFWVIGSAQSDLWILKINSEGDTLWTKTIGETNITEKGTDIIKYDENSFIIVGSKYDPGDGNGSEIWLVKTDSTGNLIWQKSYGTPAGSDNGVAVQRTADGSIIIAGNKYNADNASGQQAWVIKTDSEGDSLWSGKFPDSNFNVGSPLIVNEAGEIIFVYKNYYPDHGDIALIKMNTDGDVTWDKYIYNQYSAYTFAAIDNRLLLGGTNDVSGFLLMTDSLGDSLWSDTYTELYSCYSFTATSDGGIIILGEKNGFFSLIKLISADLQIKFDADKKSGPLPFTCHFTDSSSATVNSWQWDFENDGNIDSHEQNPIWTYLEADSYTVKLVVSNGVFSDTLIKENYVVAYQDTFPNLYAIQDIPNDQGGWVKVQFAGSAYDTDSLVFPKAAAAELYTVEIDDGWGWTAAASTTAYGKSLYSILVPTTKDSTAESNGLINFRVIAAMNEGIYASEDMTGYSVDNLAPVVPQGLLAKQSGTNIELSWQKNNDNDFKYYIVYRGDNGSQLQAINTTIESVFNDQDITAGHDYSYALSATDHSGNESALSETINLTVTALDELSAIPDKYYLGQNFPNPFNPTTTITFGLKESTKVRLMVYDILGNQVTELVNSVYSAGRYQVEWDGTNSFAAMAGTGIYYYKLETERFTVVRKMIYIK